MKAKTHRSAETGIAMSLANFKKIVQSAIALDTRYKPSSVLIGIPNLQSSYSFTKIAVEATVHLEKPFITAKANRADAFALVKGLFTKVMNALLATDDVPAGIIADARTTNNKIH